MPLINYIGNRQEALVNNTGGFVRGNAPPAPALALDYLVVGGGGRTTVSGYGGGAGGFLTGSFSASFNSTLDIIVGLGAPTSSDQGGTSSISSSLLFVSASGGQAGNSGGPTFKNAGLGGPEPIGKGGGAGSAEDGVNGVVGLSGRGGSGSLWLNGTYYAGGGGGGGNSSLPSGNGAGGIGGGGIGEVGGCTSCVSGSNGVDGTGGGAGGAGGNGGVDLKGGSGIVIVRYLTSSLVPPYDHALSGGSLSITGSYAYITFTGSSQLTYSF